MVSAIEQNEYIVVIPWAVNILIFLKYILPVEVGVILNKGSKKSMDRSR